MCVCASCSSEANAHLYLANNQRIAQKNRRQKLLKIYIAIVWILMLDTELSRYRWKTCCGKLLYDVAGRKYGKQMEKTHAQQIPWHIIYCGAWLHANSHEQYIQSERRPRMNTLREVQPAVQVCSRFFFFRILIFLRSFRSGASGGQVNRRSRGEIVWTKYHELLNSTEKSCEFRELTRRRNFCIVRVWFDGNDVNDASLSLNSDVMRLLFIPFDIYSADSLLVLFAISGYVSFLLVLWCQCCWFCVCVCVFVECVFRVCCTTYYQLMYINIIFFHDLIAQAHVMQKNDHE